MKSTQTVPPEILELIGAIVLSTQEAEKFLKIILPFMNPEYSSMSGVLKRADELKLRTFGALKQEFVESSTFISDDFQRHLSILVERRNNIVHHFHENYSQNQRNTGVADTVAALSEQLNDVNAFRDALTHMSLQLLDALRETTFRNTPECQELGEICDALRKKVGI